MVATPKNKIRKRDSHTHPTLDTQSPTSHVAKDPMCDGPRPLEVRKNRGVHKLKLKNSEREREENKDLQRSFTLDRESSHLHLLDLLCLHNHLSSSLLPTKRGLNGSSFSFFLFCFYCSDFIRLMRKIVLCFKAFDYVLCFCSDCGMFYFVTVEIKK